MDLFQSIDAFLELDVVGRKLCLLVVSGQLGAWVWRRTWIYLVIGLPKLFLDILLCSASEGSN